MYLYEYKAPLHSELIRLGYNLAIEPTEQDIMLTKLILTSTYSDLDADITIFSHWHFRDVTIPCIRVYAYYINNPQQFNHEPRNIVGSAIKQMFNNCIRFLCKLYKKPPNHVVKVRNKLVKNFEEQFLTIYYPTANNLAKRVKYNTILQKELDLNSNDRININLFH